MFDKYFDILLKDFPLFSDEEVEYLKKYGIFMEKLHFEKIDPKTERQIEFVEFIKSGNEPNNFEQIVWNKFLKICVIIKIINDWCNNLGYKEGLINQSIVKNFGDVLEKNKLNIINELFSTKPSADNEDIQKDPLRQPLEFFSKSNSFGNTCKFCLGDGGINGNCFNCFGKGWVDND